MGARRFAFVAALVALCTNACAGNDALPIATTEPGPTATQVVAKEMEFTPSKITHEPGTAVFHVVNRGKLTHTFSVGDAADEVRVNPGKSADLTIKLEPGTYDYVCRILDHEGLGMHGVLTVRR